MGHVYRFRGWTDVVAIHGAWSTPLCFGHLAAELDHHVRPNVQLTRSSYFLDSMTLDEIVDSVRLTLDNQQRPVTLVGHSLGGLFALKLHDHPKVKSIVTVSAPLAGIQLNRLAEVFLYWRCPQICKALPQSEWLQDTHYQTYTKPITAIVTDCGFHPAMWRQNDGVITVDSQTDWTPQDSTIIRVGYNHHEVLQSTAFVNTVVSHIKGEYE